MSSNKKKQIISEASPHTIKKFDLIENYVEEWAHKLCNNAYCKGLVFIDCMCNSGEYIDVDGNTIYGTPVRVAAKLRDMAGQYPKMNFALYFNDYDKDKINHLKTLLPNDKSNFFIRTSTIDGNEKLRNLSGVISKRKNIHTLLIYDPYIAAIDWDAIEPYLNTWGEVILNHMVSDTKRAVKQAKKPDTILKYEQTYLSGIEEIISYNGDQKAYEERIESIIKDLRKLHGRDFFVASFPFFNSCNSLVYNLIHCTGHIEGFSLYKKTAWKVFGGKSSAKNTHGKENQLSFGFDECSEADTQTDEYCYYIHDISKYIKNKFSSKGSVALSEIWDDLYRHPIFPSNGFRKEIKKDLETCYGVKIDNKTVSFIKGEL